MRLSPYKQENQEALLCVRAFWEKIFDVVVAGRLMAPERLATSARMMGQFLCTPNVDPTAASGSPKSTENLVP